MTLSKDRGMYLKVGVKPTLLFLPLLPFPNGHTLHQSRRSVLKVLCAKFLFPPLPALPLLFFAPSLPPFTLSLLPSLSLPSRSLSLLSLPLEVGPFNAARGSGEAL